METKLNLNLNILTQIYYSDNMRNKYIIKYDCNKMPPDYNDFTLLDITNAKKIKYGNGEYIQLNCYTCGVIIESKNEDFEFNISGNWFQIKKGKKYIPKFTTSEFLIKIIPNLKIYTSNKNSFNSWFISSMLKYMNVILDNLVVIKKNSIQTNTNGIVIYMGLLFDLNFPAIKIDENKFYHDYQEYHKEKKSPVINSHIFLFDNLVQTDTI